MTHFSTSVERFLTKLWIAEAGVDGSYVRVVKAGYDDVAHHVVAKKTAFHFDRVSTEDWVFDVECAFSEGPIAYETMTAAMENEDEGWRNAWTAGIE